MKRFVILFMFLVAILLLHSQTEKQINDLEFLESTILKKDYLFTVVSKSKFKDDLKKLKTKKLANDNQFIWEINKILTHFKNTNLFAKADFLQNFPFRVLYLKNGLYIIKIASNNAVILGNKITKINTIKTEEIINKIKQTFYLPHRNMIENFIENNIQNKELLNFLDIVKLDTLQLTTVSKSVKTHTTNLTASTNLNLDLLTELKIKKPIFNKRKQHKWFWTYGINFGKQLFFKYQIISSKEHISKMLDSLNISSNDYAKQYKIRLQEVYDAPFIKPTIAKIILKFKKKSYKKLIIDLRNTNKGTYKSTNRLRCKLQKIKKLKRNNNLKILINKTTNAAGINLALTLKKTMRAQLIGSEIYGIKQDINNLSFFELPNTKIKIHYPIKTLKTILILPDIYVKQTINQYISGIDPFLQKALE